MTTRVYKRKKVSLRTAIKALELVFSTLTEAERVFSYDDTDARILRLQGKRQGVNFALEVLRRLRKQERGV